MSNCCGNNEPKKAESVSSCCGDGNGKTILLYACSCGANVGEIADKAAPRSASQSLEITTNTFNRRWWRYAVGWA